MMTTGTVTHTMANRMTGGSTGTLTTAVTHQAYAIARRAVVRHGPCAEPAERPAVRDRGAVSLEQVLWFVAAGISVAVIAAILWGQIRDTAETPIVDPQAP
jgi:hypothetical protein